MTDENKINEIKDEELEKVSGGSGAHLFHYVVKTWKYCLALMSSHQQGKILERLFDGDKVISYGGLIDGKDYDGTPCQMLYVGRDKSSVWGFVNSDGLSLEYWEEE